MSYILDALRKSDQLRQRGAAPTLLLGQAAAAAPKQPKLFSYGLLALVLLTAGIAIGWLRPWQPEPAPAAVAARLPEPARLASPALPPAAVPVPDLQVQNPPPAAPLIPAPAPLQAPEQAPAPAPNQAPSARGTVVAAAPPPAVMSMAELPLAIQQELPPMLISVHAYSGRAADRLVGINSRLLHEGEEVAPGLRLESITTDGMVLSYKGYNFRRGVH